MGSRVYVLSKDRLEKDSPGICRAPTVHLLKQPNRFAEPAPSPRNDASRRLGPIVVSFACVAFADEDQWKAHVKLLQGSAESVRNCHKPASGLWEAT
jgi:hypothetical protein